MTTPSPSDGAPDHDGAATGDVPYLPPARPLAAPSLPSASPPQPSADAPPHLPADAPYLPSARPPVPASPAPEPVFDAKAMVASQKHFNANPAYGAMPVGTEESRAAARRLRDEANRKRKRGRVVARTVGVLVLVGLAAGGFLAYQAFREEAEDDQIAEETPDDGDTGGALSPLGEQQQAIELLDDVNSGAQPGGGGLLDAVDDAREVVSGQAPSSGAEPAAMPAFDAVLTPAVLEHTEVLEPVDGTERFVVRGAELAAVDPGAHAALVELLLGFPQVPADDPRLVEAPVVLPGDIGITIVRDGDRVARLVAVAAEPVVRAAAP